MTTQACLACVPVRTTDPTSFVITACKTMDLSQGKCPSCDTSGLVGSRCLTRGCEKRGYRFVPLESWESEHQEGATPDPMVGVQVGDFLVVGVVGAGGFGKVYLALQAPLFELKGALKIIDFEAEEGIESLLLEKFRVEAQTLAQVDHPNIVRLLKYGGHQGKPYLVMEYLANGITLQDEMLRRYEQKIPRDREFVSSVLEQVLHGLEHMHDLGLIHRDIKPENIMLQKMAGNPYHVRLLDFGLAKSVLHNDQTQLPTGTPMYMAPEQLYMTNLGPWTDLYAVASIACWLTTGLRPYPGNSRSTVVPKKLQKRYDPSARLHEAGISAPFVAFFHDALHHDPDRRIRDVATWRARFGELLALTAAPESFAQPAVQSPTIALHSEELGQLTEDADASSATLPPLPNSPVRTRPPTPQVTLPGTPVPLATTLRARRLRALGVVGLASLVLGLGGWWASQSASGGAGSDGLQDGSLEALRASTSFDRAALIAQVESVQRGRAGVARALELASERGAVVGAAQREGVELLWSQVHQAMTLAEATANTPRVLALAAGKFHTCALLWDGGVRCWGMNKQGELGLGMRQNVGDDEPPYRSPRVNLSVRAVALASGGDRGTGHNCILAESGQVHCWGSNAWGQLGLGHTDTIGDDEAPDVAPHLPLPDHRVVQITAASAQHSGHSCARGSSGWVWCWGRNNYGQLGLGHTDTMGDDETLETLAPVRFGPHVMAWQIASGKYHNCAILGPSGGVSCWGRNSAGQLGRGHREHVGDDEWPEETGQFLRLKGTPEELALGRDHSCARTQEGLVWCWGSNTSGQLGQGELVGPEGVTSPEDQPPVPLGFRAVQIVSGDLHMCALSATGTVRCWGGNKFGQLGATHTRTVGDDETPETQAEVAVGGEVAHLAAGSYHTCALLTSGKARCWGSNSAGQLGYGHTIRIGDSETPSHAGDIQIFGKE